MKQVGLVVEHRRAPKTARERPGPSQVIFHLTNLDDHAQGWRD